MELAVESLDGLGNPQRLLFEIDVLPSQSAHLAPTEAEHQHRGPQHVIAFILDGDEQVSSLLDRQRFLDYRPWRFDPHELDDVAGDQLLSVGMLQGNPQLAIKPSGWVSGALFDCGVAGSG